MFPVTRESPSNIATAFALFCVVANWSYSSVTEKNNSTIGINLDGARLIIIISAVLVFLAGRSVYKSIRVCLDQGIKVPQRVKFIAWSPCLWLAPMLISWSIGGSSSSSSGGLTKVSFGYGSDYSVSALAMAALAIVTYQIAVGLFPYRKTAGHPVPEAWKSS